MVKVKEILLEITFPDTGLGMVFMQPFVELHDDRSFHWHSDKKQKQIDRIIRTLEISKLAEHGCDRTHFTFFPEYAIPGLDGVQRIQDYLENEEWKDNTIVVGGVDGLSKDQYTELCNADRTFFHVENAPGELREPQWVNCCVIWVKYGGGVERYVQPKLVRAREEELRQAGQMWVGKAVYVFVPKISIHDTPLPFRFLVLICKDWIGNIGGTSALECVLSNFWEQRDNKPVDIHMCAVIKRNAKPDYPHFFQSTSDYLRARTYPGIRRADGMVLFVNNAGRCDPGHCSEYGKSGFVFPPDCSFLTHREHCPPSYTLKRRSGFASCKEARFRENGACIVSFKIVPPISSIVTRDAANPLLPIDPAIIHPIDDIVGTGTMDPRAAGMEVPAAIKWVYDHLDNLDFVLENRETHLLRGTLEQSHHTICRDIRGESNEALCKHIALASCNIDEIDDMWIGEKRNGEWVSPPIANVDNWRSNERDSNERDSLECLVHSLSVLNLWKTVSIGGTTAHAKLKCGRETVDIVVVTGGNHGKCFKYATDKHLPTAQNKVLVITHDGRSLLSDREQRHFNSPDDKDNITDPYRKYIHRGYINLYGKCTDSETIVDLSTAIAGMVGL